ncbi:hypothetical protein Cs7R123_00410 [Catellatospora sp. TT07R-123]|uniref:hypothetical protein n=1 Tax=Catellatospora sp. TT07R-123 TaxID=2733863 RepID=UPI001B03E922|nr:hypothetical protein [Catellatospora sp. TT07R-123]GHJ42699.1 hypothetical protein Cs7R123_00410 [Catellatospora sp. TT07R-123]
MPRPPLSSLFRSTTTDLIDHYPDLLPLRDAVRAQNWPAVEGFFASLPPQHDPTVAVAMVAKMKRVEIFLSRSGGDPVTSPLAATLLGARLVWLGWEIRTAAQAQYVSDQQFKTFHEYLSRADRLLNEVTSEQPDDIAAWTTRVRIARGLGLGQAEARRRYERAAKARPHPLTAQLDMVQQLCPKWGGSAQAVQAFARECVAQAPPGSLNGAVMADAYLELVSFGGGPEISASDARQDLLSAAAASALDPAFRQVHGWVAALNLLTFALMRAGRPGEAGALFTMLDNRLTEYPWNAAGGSAGFNFWSFKVWSMVRGGRG